MRKLCFLLPLLWGCTSKPAMSQECFAEIEMGMRIEQVEKQCGPAYTVRTEGGNTDVYEYLENVYMGDVVIQTRRYVVLISDGKVVGKYIRYSNTPGVYQGMYPETPYPNF